MMRTPDLTRRTASKAGGFTLPSILVVVGALLILSVGLLLIVGIERSTARSYVDRERADLAAKAGLEEIRGVLNQEASNDDYLIIQGTASEVVSENEEDKDRQLAPFLYLTRGQSSGSNYKYKHFPLFSTKTQPTKDSLDPPVVESLVGSSGADYYKFETLPYQDKVMASWMPVLDKDKKLVARYAYWVEDLQGKIDPAACGNDAGSGQSFARLAYPFPAPGLNPDPVSTNVFSRYTADQIASYAIDPLATEDQQGNPGKNLFKNRDWLVSPESTLAAAGFSPPLQRLEQSEAPDSNNANVYGRPGQLVDKSMRAIEESTAPGLRGYEELALVPFADGIDPSVAGDPKLNLNKLLATGGDAAVNEMATFIKKALPKFESRKGGFPDDYLKTLAANALDYADTDSNSTTNSSTYRGVDSYPLVSEFLMQFRWETPIVENGRKFFIITAATYVELWNPSTKNTTLGTAEMTYETAYKFPLGAIPEVSLADLSDATPKLTEKDGYRWFPPFSVTLKPNEYQVFHCGTITYKIDVGPASVFIVGPLELGGEAYGASKAGYRLKWNGTLVDQSRGGIHRNNSNLYYPTNVARNQLSQATRCTIPSHSHTRNGTFRNNMGDPRMSFYNQAPQDANAYPDNYSPNRRNVRWGTIYRSDGPNKTLVYGRVMPSEWPDGGHNSTLESTSYYTEDKMLSPVDARFMPSAASVLRNPNADEAPMRLSNLGRFYSATELGRVYDPIMWENASPTGANQPWGDVRTSSASSTDFGGGNSLRIGRPEHQRFDVITNPGLEAYHLLDLFHAGDSCSEDKADIEGDLVRVVGKVNLNTASRDTLRALAIGAIKMDPLIAKRTNEAHITSGPMAPPTTPYKPTQAEIVNQANQIADAIVALRNIKPFASPSAIAEATAVTGTTAQIGKPVFGNTVMMTDGNKIHRTDSAAEEVFGRMYEAGTVRSRNFRIWVVGQSLSPTAANNTDPEVLAEVRKAYTVFADPGERDADGNIDPTKTNLAILHENNF